METIDNTKLDLFEDHVLKSLKRQPPSAFGRDFMLDERIMKVLIKRTVDVYNTILGQDVTTIEKHLMIATTMASLVCEKAFLESVLEGVTRKKDEENNNANAPHD